MRTVETRIFKFEELNEACKKAAIQDIRISDEVSFFDYEHEVIDFCKEKLKTIGFDIELIKHQGLATCSGKAVFRGNYIPTNAEKQIRGIDDDSEIIDIGIFLETAFLNFNEKVGKSPINWPVSTSDIVKATYFKIGFVSNGKIIPEFSNSYFNELEEQYSIVLDIYQEFRETVEIVCERIANWIYKQIWDLWIHVNSDEFYISYITDMEIEFFQNGTRKADIHNLDYLTEFP